LNQIENNYFIKEDKNEVEKYHHNYLITISNNRRTHKWLNAFRDNLMFVVAYVFAKTDTNTKFITELIECVTNKVTLK
jgi:hypothetical protein